ncbi:phosphate acyltransferase [Calycomorphotria hydatis]|uniref:Phosphate acetyltransferase n=1 Tax=Calycomorphotria hydatis TaxID=2528027 RepID=A0A517TEV7_9PLAN|nr:phosphate acyltransferase [Calycomorphotria hydatis]QDT66911.1 Phosphate acetyltransferase [Calycomorphotria hydatis]
MPLPTFEQLFAITDELTEPIPVVAAGGADRTVLEALAEAAQRGWVKPLLTGKQAEMESIAAEADIDLSPFTLIDSDTPAQAAVAEIRAGRAAALMKGQIPTPELMKAVLDRENGLRTEEVIGQIVLMEIVRDQRAFLMTDTGISPFPNVEQRAGLIRHAISTAEALGVSDPKVALMAATEKPTPAIPSTEEARQLAESTDWSPAVVEGPLSFDLSYAADAGSKKQVDGGVVGAVDAMVFPDLTSANLTVKAIMYTADCRFGGMLRGTSAPVVFMSRADTTETRLRSLALTLSVVKSRM